MVHGVDNNVAAKDGEEQIGDAKEVVEPLDQTKKAGRQAKQTEEQ